MTAVDRPDKAQDEGPWRVGSHYGIHVYKGGDPVATFLRPENAREAVDAVNAQIAARTLASGRAGAGEQQRERVMDALMYAIGEEMPMGVVWNLDRVTDRLISALPELLALLGGPQPDEQPEPCRVYSHGVDGWHCAVEGPHEQHHNAAGDVTW